MSIKIGHIGVTSEIEALVKVLIDNFELGAKIVKRLRSLLEKENERKLTDQDFEIFLGALIEIVTKREKDLEKE